MYIQLVIIYFLIITYKSLISAFPINENNQCITKSGGPGECIKAGKCDTLIKNKLKIIMFNKCNKPHLICCPTITKTINNSISVKILNNIKKGDPVKLNEYPFMVALGKLNYETVIVWKCGGSIIGSKFILTAAHCLDVTNIAVGTNNLTDIKPEQTINESEFDFIPHENSNPNEKGHPNDIAIIKLKKDLVFNEAIKFITLAPKSMDTLPDVGIVLGFGSTEMYGSASSNNLAQAELHQRPCPFFLKTTNQICYFGSNDDIRLRKGACDGDSGGPLFVKEKDGEYMQIGIISYSYRGCTKTANVFTSIPIFRNWIDSQQLDTL